MYGTIILSVRSKVYVLTVIILGDPGAGRTEQSSRSDELSLVSEDR